MRQRNDTVVDAVELLIACGYVPSVRRGKHMKVFWVDAHGRRHMLVIASTSRSRRGRMNSRSTLRRILRASEAGVRP